MALWIDFRTFYATCNSHLQEVVGGNFVVINEDLYDEFDEFNKKLQSYIGTECSLVKGVELISVWCRSTNTKLKPVHVHVLAW